MLILEQQLQNIITSGGQRVFDLKPHRDRVSNTKRSCSTGICTVKMARKTDAKTEPCNADHPMATKNKPSISSKKSNAPQYHQSPPPWRRSHLQPLPQWTGTPTRFRLSICSNLSTRHQNESPSLCHSSRRI